MAPILPELAIDIMRAMPEDAWIPTTELSTKLNVDYAKVARMLNWLAIYGFVDYHYPASIPSKLDRYLLTLSSIEYLKELKKLEELDPILYNDEEEDEDDKESSVEVRRDTSGGEGNSEDGGEVPGEA